MGMTGQDYLYRGGGYPGVGKFLQGGGTGGADVQIRVMGSVGINGEYGGGCVQRGTATNYGELGAVKFIQEVGGTGGR